MKHVVEMEIHGFKQRHSGYSVALRVRLLRSIDEAIGYLKEIKMEELTPSDKPDIFQKEPNR